MSNEHHTTELTDRPFLTATEVADRLGVSDKTIRKRIGNGEIQALKRGRVWQIPIPEVERITELSADLWDTTTGPTDRNKTEEMSGLNGTSTDHSPFEIEHLRCDLDAMTERALSAEKRLQTALDSIQGLTEQIDHAQQLLAVSQKSIQQLTEQNHLLLEDKRAPIWKRLFRRG